VTAGICVEYVRYTAAADRGDALIEAYRRALPHLMASPHCLAAELRRCHEAPDHFILRLEWDSLAGHLEGFRGSDAFRAFVAEVGPFIDAIDEMRHYDATGVEARRPATIHDAVGGTATFFAVARAMHDAMSADDLLGPRFRHAAESHVPHLAMWLTEVFGGPPLYSRTHGDIAPMLARHAGQAIPDNERLRFVALARAAAERCFPPDQGRAVEAFARYVDWGSRVAVDNSQPDHVANPAAGVPTWGWDTVA
jgi:truncated hemoglobin YjbI/quinol monooxygenase YgiN